MTSASSSSASSLLDHAIGRELGEYSVSSLQSNTSLNTPTLAAPQKQNKANAPAHTRSRGGRIKIKRGQDVLSVAESSRLRPPFACVPSQRLGLRKGKIAESVIQAKWLSCFKS